MDWQLTIFLIVVFLLAFFIFYSRHTLNKNVTYLKEEEFTNNMRKGQLVDIRKKEVYDEGHINGARNIPIVQLTRNYNRLRLDQPVYLICNNGKMSRRASAVLTSKGFKVYSLEGGLESWSKPLRSKK